RAIKALPYDAIIVDGEVVVLDAQGRPDFARLQRRGTLSSPLDVKHAAVELPATFFAFDLLAFDGFDLRPLPLAERKRLLIEAIPTLGAVRPLDHIEREGEAFLEQVRAMGLEGVIAKQASAPYRAGRTDQWLKIKPEPTGEFVIVGFTAPKGARGGFGALQLADVVDGAFTYAGRVGTGFNDEMLNDLSAALERIVTSDPPCGPPIGAGATIIPETKTTTWVEPVFVCEVRFREWTPDGVLRHGAFLRMRSDKAPRDCVRQQLPGRSRAPTLGSQRANAADDRDDAIAPPAAPESDTSPTTAERDAPPLPPLPPRPAEKTFNFSNLTKIYWPAEKYTKGDLVDYYRGIAPWMLPYLRNRPLVMTRFPDGIDGKSFYQKDAPEFAPSWIDSVEIWSEETQRDIRYFVCNDVESLLYVANLGSIPMHIWSSRVGSLELPDWCVVDLDPKEAPFSDVVRTAVVLHELCESIGLANYVKTTGKTGLHILLPLGRRCTYAQSRTLGELLARVVLRELGDIATITRVINKRGDKVYFDYLQNRHGQLIVAPYSARPLAGAGVSMPLEWSEVDSSLDPRAFTIKSAVERLERLGADPAVKVLEDKPDLAQVLERLSALMAG
ncbi:MAG TPA: DNA ligase D, partial [Gemmatimonadaceae bacterium]|nr:DNA ligase D [Gemmatimonadaceae bacterium]